MDKLKKELLQSIEKHLFNYSLHHIVCTDQKDDSTNIFIVLTENTDIKYAELDFKAFVEAFTNLLFASRKKQYAILEDENTFIYKVDFQNFFSANRTDSTIVINFIFANY